MTLLSRALPVILLAASAALTGCGTTNDLSKPPTPFGEFQLGYDIVVADKAEPVGPSRKATPEEWQTAMKTAIDARFRRYDGNKLYHFGVTVNAYALAVPGIPVLVSPKSVVVVSVDVWDDTARRIINAESKQFTVFEGLNGSTVIGSGLTKTREQQMQTLSENTARQINDWLVENKAWFTPEAVAARAALPPETTATLPAPAKGAKPPKAPRPAAAPTAPAPAATTAAPAN